jgi:hypothetical protein
MSWLTQLKSYFKDEWPTLMVGAGVALGWAMITVALGMVWNPMVVALISTGLFMFSLCGWKFLAVLFYFGLYSMSKEAKQADR